MDREEYIEEKAGEIANELMRIEKGLRWGIGLISNERFLAARFISLAESMESDAFERITAKMAEESLD